MPYAVDNHFFQQQAMAASPRRKTLRARLGLDPERAIILFTGRFSNVKGADILLDAVSKLITPAADSRFHSDCSRLPYLLFIGDGPMRSDLEFRAKALPAGTVHFLGFKNQTELPAFYDLCDLFVLPSRFEPWGLVVNEVMNAGRPVIVSDRVGAGFDLVEPGLNGWIYPHEESQALANCLRQALADRERLRDMGRRSLERISTWDFESDRRSFLAALKKLLPP